MMIPPAVVRYCELFSHLSLDNVDLLGELVSDDIEFRDPFNHLSGRDAFIGVMREMFEQLESPVFEVEQIDAVADGAYVIWQFKARAPLIGLWRQPGLSRIRVNEAGLIDQHLDYWDSAGFYSRIPLLGAVLRWLKARIAYASDR
ncbi:nuclear transport factor 2 family protein [Marinobacterium jannaschii]|uniref:nuclear transport factor 2 family protein n=1 Tax=Marinobacterium jannaschii TaxID=64970 RepID=UPI000489B156|nr:nuclear transport factor 2 family protein [Marinobacterium jannaschii]